MNGKTAVFLDLASLDRKDLDLSGLRSVLPQWQWYEDSAPDEIAGRIAHAQIVVANKAKLTKQALSRAKQLRLICIAATGTNNVDLPAASELGIKVCNARDYATPSVVQHVFALILNLTTQFLSYHTAVQNGRWQQSRHFCLLDFPIQELAGKNLGIIGYGVLGHAVARLAEAFGMKVLIAEHKDASAIRPGRVGFDEVIETADVITLHCPLTEQTKNLIGARQLEKMKSSAFLINAARGGIVNETALVEALRAGQIAGAAMDVLTVEPPVNGNVLLEAKPPNLIITPHIAWASRESRQRLVNEIEQNILAFQRGEPRNLVTP